MSWVKTVVESTTNAWHTVRATFLKSLQYRHYFIRECHLSQQFLLECTQSGFRSHVTHTVLVLFLKFLLRFWTETFFAETTVSFALLHRNYIILLVQTPAIYISSRPGWRSAKSTTKTLSFHQMAHDSNSKCEEILRCLPHFVQNLSLIHIWRCRRS